MYFFVAAFLYLASAEIPIKISTGGYFKKLPQAIVYEATIPVTYEGAWFHGELTKKQTSGLSCPRGPECMGLNKLKEISTTFEDTFNKFEDSINPRELLQEDSKSRKPRSFNFVGEWLNYCCGVATEEKLDNLAIDERYVQEQFSKLSEGLDSQFQGLTETVSKFNLYANQTKNTFEEINDHLKVLDRFSENTEKYMQLSKLDTAIHLLSTEAIDRNLRHFMALTYLVRNIEILNSCKNKLIPTVLLPPRILKADLKELDADLKGFGYKITIPIAQISKYYKIKIAGCSIGGSKIILHVKVPISKIEDTWRLLELVVTPFAWKDNTCKILQENTYVAVNKVNQEIRPIMGTNLHHCEPY